MWKIGIIEDQEDDCNDIQVSIWDAVADKNAVGFKAYSLEKCDKEELLKNVMNDIADNIIQTLLVDYKIDTRKFVMNGGEIVKYLHDRVPDFPVIVMTNVLESRESPDIDSDKVYPKIKFFDTDTEVSREMVQNILRNIRRYEEKRKDLEGQLDLQLNELTKDISNQETLKKVLQIETELGRYKEMGQTVVDQALDMEDLRTVIKELQDIEGLLGE